MRAMIAILVSLFLGLLASCSGGMQIDTDDLRSASMDNTPTTDPDYIWYAMGDEDDLE